MHRRILTTAMAVTLSFGVAQLLCAPLAAFAQTAAPAANSHAATGTAKMVKFLMRNDSSTPLTIQAGDQQMTLRPGQTMPLKLQEGLQVTTLNGTAHIAPGALLTTVSRTLQGNTLAVS